MIPVASNSVAVLFVCLGNICRSPTAEGIFRTQVHASGLSKQILVDSAGTHAYHEGESPDLRACAAALERGFDLSGHVGRQIKTSDFEYFDYILAMDGDNLHLLKASCPQGEEHRLSLMLEWTAGWGSEVPDPYYGGDAGFEHVFDMLTDACAALLGYIQSRHGLLAPHAE